MKKLAITTLLAAGLSGISFGQGTVNWNASPSVNFIAQTNTANYSGLSTALGGGQATGISGGGAGNTQGSGTTLYYYQLLYSSSDSAAPTTLTDLAGNWLSAGSALTMENGAGANGRVNPITANAAATVPWAAGTADGVLLVGWSANLGTSYATVLNELQNWTADSSSIVGPAFFGESAFGSVTASSSSITGATVFGAASPLISNPSGSPAQLDLLQTAPIPEPTSLAMAAVGGASLLLFRRRKV